LESCTEEVRLADEFVLDGRRVVLIDTPGFDDTTKSDTDILKKIAAFLATTYENGTKLSGVVYIHRISDRRFTGIAGRNFKILREICGDTSLKNVVLMTNMWGEVSHEVGEARERELGSNFLKPALDKGARMVRHHNTKQSAYDVICQIMSNHPVVLQIQHELVDQHKDVSNTAAAEAINRDLKEAAERHEAELRRAQEETARAMRERDEAMRREIEEQRRRVEEEMRRVREEEERRAWELQQEIAREELRARRLEERARMERQRAEEEHRRQMALVRERLAREAAAAEAERVRMQQQMDQLQNQVNYDSDSDGGCVVM